MFAHLMQKDLLHLVVLMVGHFKEPLCMMRVFLIYAYFIFNLSSSFVKISSSILTFHLLCFLLCIWSLLVSFYPILVFYPSCILFTALVSSVYKDHMDYMSFDNSTEFPWKLYRSISEAKTLFRNESFIPGSSKFLLVPGPVNSALCFNASSSIILHITAVSCFSTGSCATGSTLSLWILVPRVLDWAATGNVTLLKYGKLEISYGVVNDMRNGTTKPVPSVMFSMAQNGNKCLWVSMIYGSMLTNSWALIAVVIDAEDSLNVYYNGKENYVKKQSCQPHTSNEALAFSSGELPFSCVDELVVWNHALLPDGVLSIYNSTVFGGKTILYM